MNPAAAGSRRSLGSLGLAVWLKIGRDGRISGLTATDDRRVGLKSQYVKDLFESDGNERRRQHESLTKENYR